MPVTDPTLGATLQEVDIREAVTVHFRDIGHDSQVMT